MSLFQAIKSVEDLNNLLANIPTSEKIEVSSKNLIPTILADQKKKDLLLQLIPFTKKAVQNIEEYLNTKPNAYNNIEKKCKKTKYVFDAYKETVNNEFLNDSYSTVINIRSKINELNDDIKELSEVITFNYEDSIKLFEAVQEGVYVDEKLIGIINKKFNFELEGAENKEIEIIEEMLHMLEK